jgi:hypothetical protein
LIVFKAATRSIFVYGFAKNERLAAELLAYDQRAIARTVASGILIEVNCDEKAIP